mmetsp:Transcript_2274/g.5149  ORF Transcript_2274/g.5149 Transcript_2274/m.5149 type:complete len:122 (+) Transcript_2274:147-512(+)
MLLGNIAAALVGQGARTWQRRAELTQVLALQNDQFLNQLRAMPTAEAHADHLLGAILLGICGGPVQEDLTALVGMYNQLRGHHRGLVDNLRYLHRQHDQSLVEPPTAQHVENQFTTGAFSI